MFLKDSLSMNIPFAGQLRIELRAFLGMIYGGHFLITVRARFFPCKFCDEFFECPSSCLPMDGITSDVYV